MQQVHFFDWIRFIGFNAEDTKWMISNLAFIVANPYNEMFKNFGVFEGMKYCRSAM